MLSQFVLCLFVGLTLASNSPAFKDNTEYVYSVNGRTLSSLHEVADQYSGILLKAKLHMKLRPDGKLQGRISNPQYAQIHSHLPDGWHSEVQESQLNYKQLPLTQKPFQMVMKDGLIESLIVEKEVTNWEANVIKSIVSQFQLDVQGKNAIPSSINDLPNGERLDGVFKTMEETITGETETMYEIHPLPEYLVQSQPWLAPKANLKSDGEIIEVIKNKNYTNAEERPSYHYGFEGIEEDEPTSNSMGQFFSKQSSSRAIITGTLSRFVIQNSYTVNKIIVNPTLNNQERGSVISMVNVTLFEVNTQNGQQDDLANPVEIGNLVYTYETPFSQNNEVRRQKWSKNEDSSEESSEESEERYRRFPRSASQYIGKQEEDEDDQLDQLQPRPQMNEAPESPLLPYLVGYHGRSIKQNRDFDIEKKVKDLLQEISEEIQDPEETLSQSTLSKYVMLSSIVRLMDEDEIKQVAEQVYTQEQQGKRRLAWVTYRDAVAQAGTGPAFLNIKQWIESRKIEKFEAAEVVTTMARSARTPTEEYMRKFYELVKSSEVKHQAHLNESAVLSYTALVHKVYVNRNESHNQYPVHSFGSFRTKQGKEFVKETVIPYLRQQLDEAVQKADARKIHVYIRALGNVGHKKILEAFEPYLEGDKQVSQFQRMLMVAALDKLASSDPVVARSVLYKIYQNSGEIPEIRVVAVYELFRTSPSVEMLQAMAERTNVDDQEKVNAAVKSLIENAAELESSDNQELQQAAESAKPLLTRKQYGGDKSYIDIRDYVSENLDIEFGHEYLQVGSEDHDWPRIFQHSVRSNANGMERSVYNFKAMVSSLKELFNVLEQQTEQYQKQKSQRSQQQSGESKWSSANLAKILNYQADEREQVEGFIYAEIYQIQKVWSFDNQSIENLPEEILEQERIFKNGKQFNYTKLRNIQAMALSFPTEMGLPFLYTYDVPLLIKVDGKVQASAEPQISQNDKLHMPEQINAKVNAQVTVSTKVQSRLTFVTPFDHQEYVAGFDKNIQAHLPIRANAQVDVKNKEANIEFQIQEPHKDARLLHYSTWPYTSRSDVMTTVPVALRPNTRVIKPQVSQYRYFDTTFGKKQTGLAFRVWGHHPQQSVNLIELATIFKQEGFMGLWQNLWDENSLQQTEASIAYKTSQSSARKATLRFRYQHEYKKQPESQQQEQLLKPEELSSIMEQQIEQRQQEMLKHVGSGIKSAHLRTYDVTLEFEGDKKYQHTFGFAFGKSNAAPESRVVVYYKNAQEKQYALQVKGYIPNTNGLDLSDVLKSEPQAKYEVRFDMEKEGKHAQISANMNYRRSEDRKQYLMEEEPMYHICKQEMQEGNLQLPACQNMTIEAGFLDEVKIEVHHKNLDREAVDAIEGFFKGARVLYYPMTEIEKIQPEGENKVNIKVQFQPEDFRQMNITVRAGDEQTRMYNLSMCDDFVRTLVKTHPVFHLKSRFIGALKGWRTFRPTCVIDGTAAKTMANSTYPLTVPSDWTVVMQYIPEEARRNGHSQQDSVEQQLQRQQENYAVVTRQVSHQQKEVMITFNHPQTKGKTVEIAMKPKQQRQNSGSDPAAQVYVDGQQVQFNDKEIADLYKGFVEIYALPNGEVKVEIKDAFYLIFNGQNMKITLTNGKLRDSIVGLCGKASTDKYEDFTVPSNCVVRDIEQFVKSYQVQGNQQPRKRSNEWQDECIEKDLPLYTDVISDRDTGRKSGSHSSRRSSGSQLRHQYVEDDGEICFTIRPIPTCKNGARQTTHKNVAVHCVENSKTAYHLKNQIDKGGNPDFSHKKETKQVRMEIPQQCN